jgi:hypothetical protein
MQEHSISVLGESMKASWVLVLALSTSIAFAASVPEVDPPLTQQELTMLKQMRAQWAGSGMPAMTPEQELALIGKMRGMQVEMMGNIAGMRMAAEASMSQAESEEPVGHAASALPPERLASVAGVAERRAERQAFAAATAISREDGAAFVVNGAPVIDTEGEITALDGSSRSGDYTYFVRDGAGRAIVKFQNANARLAPLVIGSLEVRGKSDVLYVTADGHRVAGNSIRPLADGVLVIRGATLFHCRAGEAPVAVQGPAGFEVTRHQRGDVAGTGYILMARKARSTNNPVKELAALVKPNADEQDLALVSVVSGNHVLLRRSLFELKFGDSEMYKTGIPDAFHYFWAAQWMATSDGPTAVVRELASAELNVIRLDSGERANAFTRKLGVGEVTAEPTSDGSIRVNARWAFKDHTVEDVRSLFAQTTEAAAPN